MRRRLVLAAAALSFTILSALLIWQGSFRISYSPSDRNETIILWAVSTVIFLLTITLGFLLFRAGVKVYIDRQRNREGSRIRSKLLAGALLLTLAPAIFFVLFSVYVLNRHLDTWFGRSTRDIEATLQTLDDSYGTALQHVSEAYRKEAQARVQAEANWISLLPETREAAQTGRIDAAFFRNLGNRLGIRQIILFRASDVPMLLYQRFDKPDHSLLQASSVVANGSRLSVAGTLEDPSSVAELAAKQDTIHRFVNAQSGRIRLYQDTYFWLICLITLFVLFFASWVAQILSRQISIPISALLGAAQEVRRGNLSYRVRVNAMDELATLVRAFNEMTNELEANGRELEARRRFTEAILESIPTGVISISTDERIERVNRALSGIFPQETVSSAKRLADLFPPEDLAEVRYVLKRARRTGTAACQLDRQTPPKDGHRGAPSVLHLAVTVASLEEQRGFVMVLEDTSDLLRAQKAIAWQEVARRIAHEIKNPLTPISLCADRIGRQLLRLPLPDDARAILEECTAIIQQEVQTVKSLVNEFSQFSRFPSAKPVPADLNEIVESAMAVFAGRLDGITLSVDLDRKLPQVMADREQMKRVIVNLVDNAAEAMNEAPVRQLLIATSQSSPDTVELTIADTGPGVSPADKEKLFLPYFSTKERGTGLGLAIVSRIIKDHHGRVKVDDNYPSGTRFTIELNALPGGDLAGPENGSRRTAIVKV